MEFADTPTEAVELYTAARFYPGTSTRKLVAATTNLVIDGTVITANITNSLFYCAFYNDVPKILKISQIRDSKAEVENWKRALGGKSSLECGFVEDMEHVILSDTKG